MIKKDPQKEIRKAPAPETKQPEFRKSDFAFERQNYILLIAGIVVLALGYLLMIGGGSKDPNVFSTEIFSFTRLTLAPILIISGFIIEIFAIMWKPKEKEEK
jgi:hypothetical protein